jgi:carbon-monoxide dehydrogenase medium subunit
MMKLRLAQPETLIDINGLSELSYLEVDGGELRIGALTRHAQLLDSAAVGEHFAILHDAEKVIADPVVRNWGTVGGSLCQADPSEDLSAVCTAVNASCVIRGRDGERVVTMEEFHRGPYETAVADNEILTEVRIPLRAGGSSAYAKVERRAGDWAVVSCGAAVWMDGGVITDARVGLAAVGPNTTGLPAISEALRGKPPSEQLYAEAGAIAAAASSPSTDQRGSADYKRHLADELTRRVLRTAVARIATTDTAQNHIAGTGA